MSKTDNTRPLVLQWEDPTNAGELFHDHKLGRDCDYSARTAKRRLNAGQQGSGYRADPNCYRLSHHYGGMNGLSGGAKRIKRQRNRQYRSRQNQLLRQAAREGLDFDGEFANRPHPYHTVAYAIWSW